MRLVVIAFVLVVGGCCVTAPVDDTRDLARTWSNPPVGSCPGPAADDNGELGCRFDTPPGCVCGIGEVDDAGGRHTAGGCYDGACCKGCWDATQRVCFPGNDARGWGNGGAPCIGDRPTPRA